MSGEHDLSEQIRVKVRDWLLEDDFSIEDKTAAEGVAWFFLAIRPDGKGFGISQRAGKPDEVYIRLTVELDKPPTGDLFNKMSAQKRNDFYNEVKFNLLPFGAEFQPIGKTVWSKIVISERIFNDALTKDELLRRILNVHRAATALGWMVNELMPEAPLGQDLGFGPKGVIH